MTIRFSCTIHTSANDGETRAAERAKIQDMLQSIAHQIGDGTTIENASVKDRGGHACGEFTYFPSASK
jgi:hypothetical protein